MKNVKPAQVNQTVDSFCHVIFEMEEITKTVDDSAATCGSYNI